MCVVLINSRCVPSTMQEKQWLKELVEGGVLHVHSTGSEASSFEYLLAHFGSRVSHEEVVRDLVMSKPAEACEPLEKDVKGKAVLVRRGSCSFVQKAEMIQSAGGVAMIVSSLHSHLLRMVSMYVLTPPHPPLTRVIMIFPVGSGASLEGSQYRHSSCVCL